jgi:mannose-1-phosphate guanylyltransferase
MRHTLPQLTPDQIIVEPEPRDTAAAVALATRAIQILDEHATIAMLPADHFMADVGSFQKTLHQAFALAESGERLVTIGITPTRPATGYGYLERDTPASDGSFKVRAFKEKPDLATAQQYVLCGNYFWNSGIFVWRVPVISSALAQFAPETWNALSKIDPADASILELAYPTLPKISIDYAVMERAQNVYGLRGDFGWDDVGEWAALERLNPTDTEGNVSLGNVCAVDCGGSIMLNDDPHHLLAILAAQSMVVVHTSDATLVAPASRSQELKRLLAEIKQRPDLKKFYN